MHEGGEEDIRYIYILFFLLINFFKKIQNLSRPVVKSAYQKIVFLFLDQNICCDSSFEHQNIC